MQLVQPNYTDYGESGSRKNCECLSGHGTVSHGRSSLLRRKIFYFSELKLTKATRVALKMFVILSSFMRLSFFISLEEFVVKGKTHEWRHESKKVEKIATACVQWPT